MAPTLITKAASSRKRKRNEDEDDTVHVKSNGQGKDEVSPFKQKTLILSSRGFILPVPTFNGRFTSTFTKF